jgi:hypothetical protein
MAIFHPYHGNMIFENEKGIGCTLVAPGFEASPSSNTKGIPGS